MGRGEKRIDRIGEEKLNNQGYLMRIIEYNSATDIIVEFDGEYNGRIKTWYANFQNGTIKNLFAPSVYEIGIIGNEYPVSINGKITKEYNAWYGMLKRCFDEKYKNKYPAYKYVTCCKDFLYYSKFYEWLHNQPNFYKWIVEKNWNVDKDILIKGNKIYSQETCCLVSNEVNKLFTKHNNARGYLPIGVSKSGGKYKATCNNPFNKNREYLGTYDTVNEAF